VGNHPLSATDPDGLQERQITTVSGKPVPLKNNTFDYNGSKMTISVLEDATLINRSGAELKGWFQITATCPNGIKDDLHYLQYIWRQTFKGGREVGGYTPFLREGREIVLKKGLDGEGVGTLDTGKLQTDKPFYDTTSNSYRRLPRELSMFDKPTFQPGDDFDKQVIVLDTLLVGGNKVLYRLKWQVVATLVGGQWQTKMDVMVGEPTDKAPDWASGKTIFGGLLDNEKERRYEPQYYPNPLRP
jgi:hypothetical protein